MNKKKIINDPVHGFITVQSDLVFDIIQHPYFQRLRRIRQLGLTDLVYPGALHTRFHHAVGAMHLMNTAIGTLTGKGVEINERECTAALLAILLHDIGHGPFSHALEPAILHDTHHEHISLFLMEALNKEFKGQLSTAIEIFKGSYPRRFFHQLVSSQLDMDRLDYLTRDSFFTGVYEGQIGAERIIKMLNVVDDQLVVEEKAIYSIENFLVSRRLMYWQVYLHKTVISAEQMLFKILQRAKAVAQSGQHVPANDCLSFFLENDISLEQIKTQSEVLEKFVSLDDIDIWSAIKTWINHDDPILALLCHRLLHRRLFRVQVSNKPFDPAFREKVRTRVQEHFGVDEAGLSYLVIEGTLSNHAYLSEAAIKVWTKTGDVVDVAAASDLPNIQALTQEVEKHYMCWPKEVTV